MKIALIEDDSNYNYITVEECKTSNPGIGGANYQFINLFNVLSSSGFLEVYFVHLNETNFLDIPKESNIIYHKDLSLYDILSCLELDHIILPQRFDFNFMDAFLSLKVPLTIRCGNYINSREVKCYSNNIVKNVICLNWEQASKCYDTKIYKKISIIPNFINFDVLNTLFYNESRTDFRDKFIITYIGSISASKGLHILASVWHKISILIPNAELHIVGSTSLYGEIDLSIDSEVRGSYEIKVKSIFDRNLISSNKVVYHGKLGIEKYKVIINSDVGIVNPSGKSEVFTNSVIDFSLFNVPVLGKNRYGLVSMIEQGVNGYKFNNLREMTRYISLIYNNKDLKFKGLEFIRSRFSNEVHSVNNWALLFDNQFENSFLVRNKKVTLRMIFHNLFYLRVISKVIRTLIPVFPSLVDFEFLFKKFYRKIKLGIFIL